MKTTAKRYDANVYRIIRDEVIIGFATRLSNNRWCATDTNDIRLNKASFDNPKAVAAWFEANR